MNTWIFPWHDVPEEYNEKWLRLFDEYRNAGLNIPVPCPICNKSSLHQYYSVGTHKEFERNGEKYIGYGSLWQWCSSCYSYYHFSALVPYNWKDKLNIDEARLKHDPDLIENARLKQLE